MRRHRSRPPRGFALGPVGLALGIAAAWIGRPDLVVLDAFTGFALLGLGLAAWSSRPRSVAGPLMVLAGLAWFLGSLVPEAVFLHRGPLAHLLLVYPGRRLVPGTLIERAAVAAAYGSASFTQLAGDDSAAIGFAAGLVGLSARRWFVAGGAERRARLTAFGASIAFGSVLCLAAVGRLAGFDSDLGLLATYDAVVAIVAITLFADLLWGRWAQAAVTGVVVGLGEREATGTLRDRLARTLGDRTLVVAYRLPEQDGYVDEAGRPIELPAAGAGRAVTPVVDAGRDVAVLVHDATLLDDPALMSAVSAATRLAVANARLQADVRERVDEVDASRRRIVGATDEQRRRLERDLRIGTDRHLRRVAELAARLDPELERHVEAAQTELRALARGIHPAVLRERGLADALRELSDLGGASIDSALADERVDPATEAAAYFVCSEALANVAKHARASHARVRVASANGLLTLEVTDDGVGGADIAAGSGLQGLVDRVEALGGRLTVTSPPGGGTRVVAELPS